MTTGHRARRSEECLSDFTLDQIMAGELAASNNELTARRHLSGCAKCRERLSAFEAEAPPPFGSLFPPSVGTSRKPSNGRWGLLAALAAAAVMVVVIRLKPTETYPTGTRAKGSLVLSVFAKRASGEVARLVDGDPISPGDALRFEVRASHGGLIAVLGLDAAGTVTPYAPAADPMIRIEGTSPVTLPGSIIADTTLGPERIVAIECDTARTLHELAGIAKSALERAGRDPSKVVELETGCAESSLTIAKRNRL